MSVVSVRLANSLHDKLRVLAKSDGISLNQFINLALVEKTAKLEANYWWNEKGGDVSANEMRLALATVPSSAVADDDRI